jgi:hypothetical protein
MTIPTVEDVPLSQGWPTDRSAHRSPLMRQVATADRT